MTPSVDDSDDTEPVSEGLIVSGGYSVLQVLYSVSGFRATYIAGHIILCYIHEYGIYYLHICLHPWNILCHIHSVSGH